MPKPSFVSFRKGNVEYTLGKNGKLLMPRIQEPFGRATELMKKKENDIASFNRMCRIASEDLSIREGRIPLGYVFEKDKPMPKPEAFAIAQEIISAVSQGRRFYFASQRGLGEPEEKATKGVNWVDAALWEERISVETETRRDRGLPWISPENAKNIILTAIGFELGKPKLRAAFPVFHAGIEWKFREDNRIEKMVLEAAGEFWGAALPAGADGLFFAAFGRMCIERSYEAKQVMLYKSSESKSSSISDAGLAIGFVEGLAGGVNLVYPKKDYPGDFFIPEALERLNHFMDLDKVGKDTQDAVEREPITIPSEPDERFVKEIVKSGLKQGVLVFEGSVLVTPAQKGIVPKVK